MENGNKLLIPICLAVCFLMAFIYCIAPLTVGLNDNGSLDYMRRELGISQPQGNYFSPFYDISNEEIKRGAEYSGTFLVIARPIMKIAELRGDKFDIRALAVFYIFLLLASVFYFLKYIRFEKLWERILLAALLLFIFFDVAHLVFLNSLFPEAAFYSLLLIVAALYCKLMFSKRPQLITTIAYYFCCMVLVGLKENMFLAGILLAAPGIYLITIRKGYTYRVISALLAIMLAVIPFFKLNYVERATYKQNLFHSVFYGILYENDDVLETLSELELDSKLAQYAGTTFYEASMEEMESEELEEMFYNKMNYGKIVLYYLKHPVQYFKKYDLAANNAFETRPRFMGNFMDSNKTAEGFSAYSTIKKLLFPASLWFVYLVPLLAVFIVVLYKNRFRVKAIPVFVSAIAALSLLLFHIPLITYGLAEITKNMSIYSSVFDLLLAAIILLTVYLTGSRRREFQNKYGMTQ